MTASMHTRLDSRAAAVLLICCLIWGVQQTLIKATLPHVAPIFQASLRFAGGAIFLWLWCRARRVPLFNADGLLWPGLLAGLLFTGEFVALYLGMLYTTSGRLTVFLYTSPFWIALLLPLWVPAERLRGSQWAGLACAFAAVAFALREGFMHGGAGLTWRGDLLGLAGGLMWGLNTVALRASRLTHASPEKVLFYQVAVAAVLLPLLSLALGETGTGTGAGLPLLQSRCRRCSSSWPRCSHWRRARCGCTSRSRRVWCWRWRWWRWASCWSTSAARCDNNAG